MCSKTTVVNKYKSGYDVYIGRGSIFGNPFIIGKDGDRNTVVKLYEDYFNRRIVTDSVFKEAVLNLRGKRLGCFCKPHLCHGDIIVDYLNRYFIEV
jgi:hypothetical protein